MPRDTSIKITGRVRRVTFHNPENAYSVARIVDRQGHEITLVGRMPGLNDGQDIEVTGRQVLHPKFGPQVEVDQCRLLPPSGDEGVRRYLSSGIIKGVGEVLAGRIMDQLGSDALQIIVNEPDRLAKVSGIGKKKAKSISQAVASHQSLQEVMVFLQGHGVGVTTALRIYREYGAGALGVLQNEPHRLAQDIRGIGFATADAIAAKLGLPQDHPTRLDAGLVYSLRQALDQGHVFLPRGELLAEAGKLLGFAPQDLEPALNRLHLAGRVTREEAGDQENIYLVGMHDLEQRAAESLARLAGGAGILTPPRAQKAVQWVASQLSVQPSPAQARALQTLLTSSLGVLTGGPGTGKTTLVRALITIAQRMGLEVALAAPTGRAAKRLAETSGLEAATIHRLLEFSPKENRFLRGPEKPLEADLLVVDESSMIDTWLLCHLAEAVGGGSSLILVGDADQLPSVGPGLVLQQIIGSSAAKVAELKEIFRQDQAGLIVRNAHRVLAGQMPILPPDPGQSDFAFLAQPEPARAAETAVQLAAADLPQSLGLDPLSQIQVLAPMHRGLMGCANLNRLLRARLNPSAGETVGLAVGDKVMQVRNNYDLEVFNGDLGLVAAQEEDGLLVDFAGRRVKYARVDMDDLTLAYAVTIHKSQGSEYPAVVLVLGDEHFIMLNRPLLYTALTRGKRMVAVVGSPKALRRAVSNDQPTMRHASLDRRLRRALGR